ncbi:MAG: 4Fe-4S binding protein [Clostridiales bacterium]|nr:4Fe-4S binding protein [Clostridiales bacterium]
MKRQIIKIDEELCNGCGLCIEACYEGAIKLIDGKAKLVREDYCDGLGNCLPVCPTGAISFEEREALPFNEEEAGKPTDAHIKAAQAAGCPGSQARTIVKPSENDTIPARARGGCVSGGCPGSSAKTIARESELKSRPQREIAGQKPESELMQWPVQIKLVPVNAPYFHNAKLLVAADCTAFAYADFHKDFIKNHITLIGCPKLDASDYSEKLADIIRLNNIKSLTVVRMEVPCCSGIEHAAKEAIIKSGKMIPWQVKVISVNGSLVE